MNGIAKKTLNTIKERNIRPRPAWMYTARNGGFWLVFVLLIAATAAAIATTIFLLSNYDWDAYQNLHRSYLVHFFYAIPYFWIAVIAVLVALAYLDFRKTKTGYRYNMAVVAGGSVLLSLVLGVMMFYEGLDSQVDNFFDAGVPFYRRVIYDDRDLWTNAERGLLGGSVTSVENSGDFAIEDSSGDFWMVDASGLKWPEGLTPKEGVYVKLTGSAGTGNSFVADTAQAWDGR